MNVEYLTCVSARSCKQLDLHDARLVGTIPASLGALTTITSLDLSDNMLTGTLPTELGLLTALGRHMYVYNNKLAGTIPAQMFSSLTDLEVLSLDDNLLTGTIPSQIGMLSTVMYVNLNNNALSGGIPSEMSALSMLEYVYLDNNMLTGSIPGEMAASTVLQLLNVSSNTAMCGEVLPVDATFPLLATNTNIGCACTCNFCVGGPICPLLDVPCPVCIS